MLQTYECKNNIMWEIRMKYFSLHILKEQELKNLSKSDCNMEVYNEFI
jgi:hypothetical protein